MTNLQLIDEYEKKIKLLKKEIDTVAIRYYEKKEIDYGFMLSLQYLLEKEIIRLKELVKLFKKNTMERKVNNKNDKTIYRDC